MNVNYDFYRAWVKNWDESIQSVIVAMPMQNFNYNEISHWFFNLDLGKYTKDGTNEFDMNFYVRIATHVIIISLSMQNKDILLGNV